MNNIVNTINSLSENIIIRLKSEDNDVTVKKKLYVDDDYVVYHISIFTLKDSQIKGKVVFTHYNLGYDGSKVTFYKTYPIYISKPKNTDYNQISDPLPIMGYCGEGRLTISDGSESLYNKLSIMLQ